MAVNIAKKNGIDHSVVQAVYAVFWPILVAIDLAIDLVRSW